jgi:hypothetical protein
MKKFFNLFFILAIFCFIVSYDSFADAVAENTGFTLEVKDKLINLQAENACFKEILKKVEAKTGIKVKIYQGVKDKKVSLNIKSLPVYAVGKILDKMHIRNFSVVYDDQLASLAIYILPEGKDISEFTEGKSIIRHEEFAVGKTIDTIKGRKIESITKGENKIPVRYVKDEVLLKFNLGVTKQEIQEILKKHNLVEVGDSEVSKIGYIKVRIPDDRDVITIIEEIRKEYKLKIPEPNYISNVLTVSDPLFNDQWYINDTNFDKAWEKTESKDPIKIAVIDSGVDVGHPDLNGKILNGFDFVNDDTDASDDHGHGSFVAGIISAAANDIGIKGLYGNAQIIPVKVIDNKGLGTYEDVACGIIYAADNGARVINLSIGGYGYSFLLQAAVDYALEKGSILVASGGNDGIKQAIYPAGYPDVIGVSALGYNSRIWFLSNCGKHIDVSAPGLNIISTGLDKSYIYASGTSASAPMVSALAAMLVLEKPDFSSSFIERLIIQSAKDIGVRGWDGLYGSGEIDAHAALQQEVELFHDVAIGSMKMDSMAVSENDHIFVLIELENRGSFDREEVSVKLWLNDEIMLDEAKIILMGDKTIAVDTGLLPKQTEFLQFRAEITGAADDINLDNNSRIIKYQIKWTRR